jgi:hypothetical protein
VPHRSPWRWRRAGPPRRSAARAAPRRGRAGADRRRARTPARPVHRPWTRPVSAPVRSPASSGRTTTSGSAKRLRSAGPGTSALHRHPCPAHRAAAASRAASTRARTVAVLSAASPTADSAVIGYIRARRSTRSSSGPDKRLRYRRRTSDEHTQSRSCAGAHGQGLQASTSWNRAG